MHIATLAAPARSLLARRPQQKLLIVVIFLLTTVLTIVVAESVLGERVLVNAGDSSGGRSLVSKAPSSSPATGAGAATASHTLPTWDRKDRVNILLMGLDGIPTTGRLKRADSLVVASIDPATRSAVLITIPRDLYVTINSAKGPIHNRINTAFVWGELYHGPGGGPALQMRTVGEVLDLPIHHYVAVYMDGFLQLIDAIGGVDINVPEAINDSHKGLDLDDPEAGLTFGAGMQHMNGKRALAYARTRYSTSDFARGRRVQQIILAAVDKMTTSAIVPRLPAMLPTLSQAFRSDMSISDLLALASLGLEIDRSQIKTAQIDQTMCQDWTAPSGDRVLLPRWDRIKLMVQAAVPSPGPAPITADSPASATPTTGAPAAAAPPTEAVAAALDYRSEQATVEILNGTNTIGLARRAQSWLQGQGLNVALVGDARGSYAQTVLYSNGTNPATRDALATLLNVPPQSIRFLSAAGVDFRIVLGNDAKVP